jgi:hypothetical protein
MIEPDELVVGVLAGGQARAYAINFINTPSRKVINDTLGGEPILITWCDLCHTAAVHSRRIDGAVETFGCSGMLWHDMLVVYDARTESYWNHLKGAAIAGRRAGEQLRPIPSVITTWKAWLESSPHTTIVAGRRVSRGFDVGYFRNAKKAAEFLYGIHSGSTVKAWTLEALRQAPVIATQVNGGPAVVLFDEPGYTTQIFSSVVDGRELTFSLSDKGFVDRETGSRWDIISGRAVEGPLRGQVLQALPGLWAFESSWRDLFPASRIVRAAS